MSSHEKQNVFMPDIRGLTKLRLQEAYSVVGEHLNVVTAEDLESNPSIGKHLKVALLLMPTLTWPTTSKMLEKGLLPSLELVCKAGVGVDDVPLDTLKRLNLRLANTAGINSDSCADLAFALLLASARNLKLGINIGSNLLSPEEPVQPWQPGFSLSGATLGIVGMGSIGYKVAQRARGFNMKVIYCNRSRRSPEEESAVKATYHVELHSLLRESDFVVVSCPLTAETKDLFGKEEFKSMKSSAHIINIARGAIINTDDLVAALKSKEIYAAALDVTEPEPLSKNHPLLHLDNVIVLPHWGWFTRGSEKRTVQAMVETVTAFYNGEPLPSEIIL